jgi:RNA polymerase sigma factor (sigma-70 family)
MPHSVTTWIGKLRDGEPEAAQPLWERYFARLVTIARDRLRGLSRAASDEEDVALSAFHSFCQAVAAQRLPNVNDRNDLWHVLVMHTIRKAIDQRRYQQAQKRDGRLVRSDQQMLDELVGSEPSPELAAMLTEEFERLLDALGDAELRRVAIARLEGCTNAEIAQRLDCSERSVYRRLTIVRSIWGSMVGAE